MAKFIVTYTEIYSRDYEVEANSKEEAEEIVLSGQRYTNCVKELKSWRSEYMKSGLIDGVTVCCGYDFGTDANMARYCPICGKELVKKRIMRVWHIPQIPGKPFYIPVKNEKEAKKFLDALEGYDIFQFNNNVKPNFCNASGVEVFDEETNEWCDWYIETQDDYFEDIDEFLENDEVIQKFTEEIFSQV